MLVIKGLIVLQGNDGAGKSGDVTAVAIPLRVIPVREQDIGEPDK